MQTSLSFPGIFFKIGLFFLFHFTVKKPLKKDKEQDREQKHAQGHSGLPRTLITSPSFTDANGKTSHHQSSTD